MGRQQGIASDLRSHLAIAEDKVGQDSEHRCTCRALDTPDSEPTQADTGVMRVTRQAPSPLTRRFVLELEAEDEEEGENTFDKRLAVCKQAHVSGFVSEIDSDGPVFSRRFGRCTQCVTPLSSGVVS